MLFRDASRITRGVSARDKNRAPAADIRDVNTLTLKNPTSVKSGLGPFLPELLHKRTAQVPDAAQHNSRQDKIID